MLNNLRRRGSDFVYQSGDEGPIIEVKVSYELGGANYFSGNQNRRGIYVYVTPVTLQKRDGYTSRVMSLFGDRKQSGLKFFVLELKRKNDKQAERVAEYIDTVCVEVGKQWPENTDFAIYLMQNVVQEAKDQLVPKVIVSAPTDASQVSA